MMYVDNSIRHKCEELVHEFEKAVKQDVRMSLKREEELNWVLSVRYTLAVTRTFAFIASWSSMA